MSPSYAFVSSLSQHDVTTAVQQNYSLQICMNEGGDAGSQSCFLVCMECRREKQRECMAIDHICPVRERPKHYTS